MKVVVAPDKFAGTMTAAEAAHAIARGWARARPHDDVVVVPMADGGEGLIDVVSAAVRCERRHVDVAGPLGTAVSATWLLLPDGRAVVEAAEAIGLRHVPITQRDPLRTTSLGTGQLIAAAAASGCREIVVGLGGSATVDGGSGMAIALGATLTDDRGAVLPAAARSLLDVASVTPIAHRLPHVTAAVDVQNPLLGPAGAAHVFAPQKGADADSVVGLESALRRFADVVERNLGGGPWRDAPGAGAAGGLGFGLMAFAGAQVVSGAVAVGEVVGLSHAVAAADVAVTGEGSLDEQTLRGKAPDHVRRVARDAGVPVAAVAGRVDAAAAAVFDAVVELGDEGLVRAQALTEERAGDLALNVASWAHRKPPPRSCTG